MKAHPDRLGVARYVVPNSNPLTSQTPDDVVSTGSGTLPLPDTRVKVILAPEWSDSPASVTAPEDE